MVTNPAPFLKESNKGIMSKKVTAYSERNFNSINFVNFHYPFVLHSFTETHHL